MTRRQFVTRVALGLGTVGLGWWGLLRRKAGKKVAESPFDRVVFVCVNRYNDYSPGVYLHGPDGGGPECLSFAAEAARGMRVGEVGDSAAGLCGYLYTQLGPYVTSGGGLVLRDAPKPDASGVVDWQEYCGRNVDLILIDVDRRSAECHVSPLDSKSVRKAIVSRLDDLKFGG